MSDFRECNHLTGRLRELCRGEAGSVAACNHMRAGWGLPPLPADWEIKRPCPDQPPATAVVPGSDCPHRSAEPVREIPNTGCGCNGKTLPVFACALHGECTPRRVNSGLDVLACWDCQLDGKDGGLAFPEGSGVSRSTQLPAASAGAMAPHPSGFGKRGG